MKDDDTDLRPPPTLPMTAVAALEANLNRCSETIRQSLELAHSIDPQDDPLGQDKAFTRALEFMKVSAKAGLALAKVKSEFSATFKVTKYTVLPGPDPALEQARRAGDEAYWQRWEKTFARAQEMDAAGEEEVGVPPSNFGGSNAAGP